MRNSDNHQVSALESLRTQLDRIDDEVLDAIRRRLDCCVRIGHLKRDSGIAMMQPGRIQYVQNRLAKYATDSGLSEPFLQNVYSLIINEACRLETVVIDGKD